ncbi:MAG TPA: ATP-binding cassette domain-containing protein [Bacteroidia bacterium]|nr:ATP-binding cassette domain-containing protein [Bacteroidia bacterium]
MINLQNISKSFTDDAGVKNELLQALNIKFKTGDFTIIIGANGSGKSTLLNLIAGIILPDHGTININNIMVQQLLSYERSKFIARVFQNPLQGSVPDLTVMENMRLAFLRTQPKGLTLGIDSAFKEKVKHSIAQLNLGIENKLEQKMGTLSGGQRQALTLVMATLSDAKVLLMDEPTSALDPKSAYSLMQNANTIIKDKKLTTIMVTHNMREALAYGNRLLLMKSGKIEKDIDGFNKEKLTVTELFDWMN